MADGRWRRRRRWRLTGCSSLASQQTDAAFRNRNSVYPRRQVAPLEQVDPAPLAPLNHDIFLYHRHRSLQNPDCALCESREGLGKTGSAQVHNTISIMANSSKLHMDWETEMWNQLRICSMYDNSPVYLKKADIGLQ